MDPDKVFNKLITKLNELINGNFQLIRIGNLLNELVESLKIIENCTCCNV